MLACMKVLHQAPCGGVLLPHLPRRKKAGGVVPFARGTMASMHAACYAHALVPSSLDEAQEALDAYEAGDKNADDTLEELSQAAAMVRSNVHADKSQLYSKTLIQMTLKAPPPVKEVGRTSALELYGAVLGLEACKKDADAFNEIRAACALIAPPAIPDKEDLEKMSMEDLKRVAAENGVDVRLAIEKHHIVIALEAAR